LEFDFDFSPFLGAILLARTKTVKEQAWMGIGVSAVTLLAKHN